MKRRHFVTGLAAAAGVTACAQDSADCAADGTASGKTFNWNLVTSWPPGLPGLGVGVQNLADRINRASNGRLKIKVFAGGELVPALEVLDAVSNGTVQMGHDSAYYHRGKAPAARKVSRRVAELVVASTRQRPARCLSTRRPMSPQPTISNVRR